ncbi:MAG: hypothetical protein A3E78_13920 [Alphaproteobacteria bacterium RIFCSPHIGHO2_12_FULL_63_12]|nr:MAG: hypothetical protein A3E78_13920 [Alphaproteobacteria bacterium RIFCSPHIGHO2_12_FULL_63_12]
MLEAHPQYVKEPPSPLDETISDLLRIIGLCDGAAALLPPGSARTLVLESRATAAIVRDRCETWVAVSEEARRGQGQAEVRHAR